MPQPAEAPGDVTPPEVLEEADDGTGSAGGSSSTGQRWSDEDWRLWDAGQWNYGGSGDYAHTTVRDDTLDRGSQHGQHGLHGPRARWSSSTNIPDPWHVWQDPWTVASSEDNQEDKGTSGGNDKIVAPEFSGEDDKEGCKTKSYLRKVQAWRRVTRLKPSKQALVLYNSLTGKAWRDAEEIDVAMLDAPNGVEVFLDWIKERYLDKEVVKVGKYMTDFFKHFKRAPHQDIRDYNMEFDRHVAKLKEVGCVLPGVCSAWWFIDKLRLDNAAELSLLSSVQNTYDLHKLQEAAVVQDRMNRRIWESRKHEPRKSQQAYMTELDEIPEDEEDTEDLPFAEMDPEFEDMDEEAHEAYVAFQNAKAKYNSVLKARGTTPGATRDEALQKAKARSYCSVCHQKGHWHKDPVCPKYKGGNNNGATAHTTHIAYYTGGASVTDLDVIVDCACSRTLAGTPWIKKFVNWAKANRVPYFVMAQDEVFRFGGPRLYPSRWALVCSLCLEGKWFFIKISIVSTQVPLLLSRPVLAALGMHYKMDTNKADFNTLGLKDVVLDFTASGHPRANAVTCVGQPPVWPDKLDWSVTEVHIPETKRATAESAYMVCADAARQPLFYSKVRGNIQVMLTSSILPSEPFLHWWHGVPPTRDFWIESDEYLDRIHVIPRRTLFDPSIWRTAHEPLRDQLLARLGEIRETTCIPCHATCPTLSLEHLWRDESGARADFLWIGRSRFKRQIREQVPHDPSRTVDASCVPVAMEDEEGCPHGSTHGTSGSIPAGMDSAGAPSFTGGGARATGPSEGEAGGIVRDERGRPEEEVYGGEHPSAREVHPRHLDAPVEGAHMPDGRGGGVLRQLQGLYVQGSQRVLLAMGYGGSGDQRATLSGSSSSGTLGPGAQPEQGEGQGQTSPRSRSCAHGAHSGEGIAPGQDEDQEGVTSQSDEGGGQRIPGGIDTGGVFRLLRGGLASGGPDQGLVCETGGAEDHQGAGGEGEDQEGRRSNRQVKKRAYWKKVDELIKMRKDLKTKMALDYSLDTENPIAEIYDPDTLDLDEYDLTEEDENDDKTPKVNLKYPVDTNTVRNLPSRRMKRASRKRVTGWARRALSCLTTTLVALSAPLATEAYQAVIDPAVDLYHAATGPPAVNHDDPPALLELFAGSAHLTTTFAAKGYNVLEPRDILYGHDLFQPLQQENVFRDLEKMKPKLLWIALPCTKWSPWQRLNYSQRKQELRRLRRLQRRLIHFAVECAFQQIANGREVVFEHPKESDMWLDSSMESLVDSPLTTMVDLDMCRYNLRAVTDGGRLRKPTRLLSSNPQILEPLSLKCHGGHHHSTTEGRNTKPAGIYTKEFCASVVKGYQKMCGNLWFYEPEARIRDQHEALVAADRAVHLRAGGAQYHGPRPRPAPPQPAQEQPDPEQALPPKEEGDSEDLDGAVLPGRAGASGIQLPSNVPPHAAKALRRIHQNLGHPSNQDLARHLQLSGASELAVKAAQGIRCETCARHAPPGTRRPAKVIRPLDFNQEVCLDTINLYDSRKVKIPALSMLDMATGYHVVKRITGRKSTDLLRDFTDGWVSWAGVPQLVTCDQERGFLKEFTDGLDMLGCRSRVIAGQAHWQQGAVERQGQWYRYIWDKTVAHTLPTPSEIEYVLAMVSSAKNNLRRHHGYSPAQWLFGTEPRTGDAALDENDSLFKLEELRTHEELWRRKQEIRYAARMAFIESQADASLKRALWGRSRVAAEPYTAGDYVYIYRVNKTAGGKARQRQNAGEWIGPGVVIGKEGASYWVSRGGRCLLCAAEHLRPAESEELGVAFQTKALKEDLMRVVANLEDENNDEVFADASGPLPAEKRPIGSAQGADKRQKPTPSSSSKRPVPEGGEVQPDRPPPHAEEPPDRDLEDLLDDSYEAFMVEKRMPRSVIKQQDKEVKWEEIPMEERPLYKEAEAKQWKEHLQYDAVRVHPPEMASLLRHKVPRDRILPARFAYRDKNVAKRREDPSVPPKPKARLCVGGHRDPDLRLGEVNTEAPTASKTSLFTLLFLAAQLSWRLAAGDVEAAFLNGIESKRHLYFEPPRRGLPGVEEGSLIEIVKGVFGLSNSPRLWWDKLAAELLALEITVGGKALRLHHHDFDPCLLLLREVDDPTKLHGAMITHVDDLLVAAPAEEMMQLQQGLSKIFPIAEWEADQFDYTGTTIKQTEDAIELHQKSYVNSRLETVTFPSQYDPEAPADAVTKQDNMSTIGALSWLSSQTRPDLQAGVSFSQRRQKGPTYAEVKTTNKVVKMAQTAKDEPLIFTKLADRLEDLVLLVYHDAAWANVPPDLEHAAPEEIEEAAGHGIYSQLGHLLLMTGRDALGGAPSPTMTVGWKSHACPRVCRSTFAAETMAALGGWEDALCFRSFVACALRPQPVADLETVARELFPIVSLTDCKSLYDNVHRLGGPRAPTEKRLIVDLTALRKMVGDEATRWGDRLHGQKVFRWLPTTHQLADALTKLIIDVKSWWQQTRTVRLPFGASSTV